MLSLKRTMGFSAQVVVNAPPDKVFSYVTDFHRHHEWLPGHITDIRKTSDGPLDADSTFKGVVHGFSQYGTTQTKVDTVVTEYVADERLAFEVRTPEGLVSGFFIDNEPEPVGGGSRVTVRQEVLRWGWLLGCLVALGYPLILAVTLPASAVDRWYKRRKVRRIMSRLDEW